MYFYCMLSVIMCLEQTEGTVGNTQLHKQDLGDIREIAVVVAAAQTPAADFMCDCMCDAQLFTRAKHTADGGFPIDFSLIPASPSASVDSLKHCCYQLLRSSVNVSTVLSSCLKSVVRKKVVTSQSSLLKMLMFLCNCKELCLLEETRGSKTTQSKCSA